MKKKLLSALCLALALLTLAGTLSAAALTTPTREDLSVTEESTLPLDEITELA
ncbi:MAG: hypothetical protein LBJ11_08430 [Oscillospiraceae bacterium]|jgi:hypothetical protein|nr:hypothetical protein [Oscillospiraceae bacterium]